MTATIQLRRDALAKHADLAGITTRQDLAARMGMHYATIRRVLEGYAPPGERFIAAALVAFPSPQPGTTNFDNLFQVVDKTTPAA